jgi:hypothetical protein
MVFDNNSAAPQIETVSNGGLCWSTTTTGGIANANVNNCLSSSGGVISADTTTVGNGLGTFKAATFNATSAYQANGTPGVTKTCGATIVVTNGIITSC